MAKLNWTLHICKYGSEEMYTLFTFAYVQLNTFE